VLRLVLTGGFAIGDRSEEDVNTRVALVALIRANWGMGSAALTSVFFDGDVSPEILAWWHRIQREAISADDAANIWEANGRVDVRELLPTVRCPTFVLHGRDDKAVPFERGREIASGISNARFDSREGGHISGSPGAVRQGAAIVAFLREDAFFRREIEGELPSGTAIILFTDIADSTALTERMGDAPFREISRGLDSGLRTAIQEAGGGAIDGKLLGDGVLATFPSAAQAINGARRCLALSAASELGLHIGLHAGDVIREGNNVYGGAVNIASRVCALCQPGEILVSQTVRDLARTSAGVRFEARGERVLKGVNEPVRVFAVVTVDG
jgi:class 3 adenylate cyclase